MTSPIRMPLALALLAALACTAGASETVADAKPGTIKAKTPTAAEAEQFVRQAEARIGKAGIDGQRAEWVAENFITDDTEVITAQANEHNLEVTGEAALQARRYKDLKLPPETARKLKLMQLSLMLSNPVEREQYARLAASMTGSYGKAKYCPKGADGKPGPCLALGDMEKIMAESRDPARLKEI